MAGDGASKQNPTVVAGNNRRVSGLGLKIVVRNVGLFGLYRDNRRGNGKYDNMTGYISGLY